MSFVSENQDTDTGAHFSGLDTSAGARIRSFIERVENIEEEMKGLAEGKKEVFAEAKGSGFDVKVLKEILKIRKQDKDQRDEQESLLDLYMQAMENAEKADA